MKINVVTETEKQSWILRRMAEELCQLPEFEMDLKEADATFFLNYALFDPKAPGFKAGYFTHLEHEGPTRQRFIDVAKQVDIAVMMNNKWTNLIPSSAIVKVIHPGSDLYSDTFRRQAMRFGIMGRTYKTGRKGEALVQQMYEWSKCTGFCEVYSYSPGWPCRQWQSDRPLHSIESRTAFYDHIDYLVIPALNEGGPMPILDALMARVPIIAPDVGFCWDYPVIRYETGSWQSLKEVLTPLTNPRSWHDWRRDCRMFFESILGVKL